MKKILLSIGKEINKKKLLQGIKTVSEKGYEIYATFNTHAFLDSQGIKTFLVYKPSQKDKKPNIKDLFKNKVLDIIINIPTKDSSHTTTDGQYIRGTALEEGITLVTDVELAQALLHQLSYDIKSKSIKIKREETNELVSKYRNLLHPGFSSPPSRWTYDITKSYDWNYEKGPKFSGEFPKREVIPTKSFLHLKLNSLFGVPAGPLLNSQWIKLYANLGFDILTYKSLRTRSYPAFPMPHMLYVESKKDTKYLGRPYAAKYESLAMTNSFGVPSKDPDVWQEDIGRALKVLNKGQLLIVSVMGTREAAKNEEEFIKDYAICAKLALEANAPVIEVNLSCPNLQGSGIICYDIKLVEKICNQVKNAVGNVPLIAKIGFYPEFSMLKDFVAKTNKYLDGIAVINTIRGDIEDVQMKKPPMRHIESSGICGQMTRPYGLTMVEQLHQIRREWNLEFAIIGVGGVTVAEDYQDYILAGADAVQSATGAMMDPYLAYKIYKREIVQKRNYPLVKSLGTSNFNYIIGNNKLPELKKLYLDMIHPHNLPEEKSTLLINIKPFRLKHGEKGRNTSHIYLNHRTPLLSDSWDRRLLAQLLDQLIRDKILVGKSSKYGVIAVPSSSSPELTALMLDLFPDTVKRTVLLPDHVLNSEYGAHTSLYGQIDEDRPWILIDDVFTSGKTFKDSIQSLEKILGRKYNRIQFYGATLTSRNPENEIKFLKDTKRNTFSLLSLNEVLKYHWKRFSDSKKKLITKEREELR